MLKSKPFRPLLVDSSAWLDQRFIALVKMGFLRGKLIFPSFIKDELINLKSSTDRTKHPRATKALENIGELSQLTTVKIVKTKDTVNNLEAVDDNLINLAEAKNYAIISSDVELINKAKAKAVETLNINQLVFELMPKLKVGDITEVTVLDRGGKLQQGTGYLDDGTLVIVEGASKLQGRYVKIKIKQVIQKPTGLVVIAKLV